MSPRVPRFTIGALAREAGVPVETIRFYERQGLLAQPDRPAIGYRTYPYDAVERLRFIRRAKALGFSLADVSALLELRARRGAPCVAVRARALEKLAELDARIADLEALRRALADLAARCGGDAAVDTCTILALLQQESPEAPLPPTPNLGAHHVPAVESSPRHRTPRLRRSL